METNEKPSDFNIDMAEKTKVCHRLFIVCPWKWPNKPGLPSAAFTGPVKVASKPTKPQGRNLNQK